MKVNMVSRVACANVVLCIVFRYGQVLSRKDFYFQRFKRMYLGMGYRKELPKLEEVVHEKNSSRYEWHKLET
jgi:hypothetical protein